MTAKAIEIGNVYRSRWELEVTVINIRDNGSKRNILIAYNSGELALVSERELAKRYPYLHRQIESVKLTAQLLNNK